MLILAENLHLYDEAKRQHKAMRVSVIDFPSNPHIRFRGGTVINLVKRESGTVACIYPGLGADGRPDGTFNAPLERVVIESKDEVQEAAK